MSWRPEIWGNPYNKVAGEGFVDATNLSNLREGTKHVIFEAGADAMLGAVRYNTISVLSYLWTIPAVEWADKRKGKLVFIPDEAS